MKQLHLLFVVVLVLSFATAALADIDSTKLFPLPLHSELKKPAVAKKKVVKKKLSKEEEEHQLCSKQSSIKSDFDAEETVMAITTIPAHNKAGSVKVMVCGLRDLVFEGNEGFDEVIIINKKGVAVKLSDLTDVVNNLQNDLWIATKIIISPQL